MARYSRAATAVALLAVFSYCGQALAQKPGGFLRMYHFDSPASLSLHEEVTFAAQGPAMGLFNNLIMFDQHVPQAGFNSIVADLATEWSWDSSKTELRFWLYEGVKWHDGKPFSANDVKCTWDTLGHVRQGGVVSRLAKVAIIEPQIRPLAGERPVKEGMDALVNLFAQLGYLRLADAGQPHRLHQIVDPVGRHTADPGLLDHCDQGLLRALAGLQKWREIAALSQLWDAQLQSAQTGVEGAVAVTVAPGRALRS